MRYCLVDRSRSRHLIPHFFFLLSSVHVTILTSDGVEWRWSSGFVVAIYDVLLWRDLQKGHGLGPGLGFFSSRLWELAWVGVYTHIRDYLDGSTMSTKVDFFLYPGLFVWYIIWLIITPKWHSYIRALQTIYPCTCRHNSSNKSIDNGRKLD